LFTVGSSQDSNRSTGSASFVPRVSSQSCFICSSKGRCCVCIISPVRVVIILKHATRTKYNCRWVCFLIFPTKPGGNSRFEIVTAILVKIQVLWDVTLCRLVKLLTFRRSVVPPSSEWSGTIRMDLWNVGNYLPLVMRNIPENLNLRNVQ
jgi:hypothetical protein